MLIQNNIPLIIFRHQNKQTKKKDLTHANFDLKHLNTSEVDALTIIKILFCIFHISIDPWIIQIKLFQT